MIKKKILFRPSKNQFIIGILLGLVYAIFFFNFLLACKKGYKLLIASIKDYEVFYLNDNENSFYLFLYAFIAVFFSYSIIINYWLNQPNKIFSRYNYKRKFINNQQQLTNWFFMSWFSRIGIFIGLISFDYKDFNFYGTYKYVAILFFFAFIGQIWMSLRFFFCKNRMKWLFKIFFSTLLLSLCISKVNFLQNNKPEEAILQKNILNKFNIQIVTGDNFKERKFSHLDYEIFISSKKGIPTLIINDMEIAINNKEIQKFLTNVFEAENPKENRYKKCILFIDKNVSMHHIYSLKKLLAKIGITSLRYSVHKENPIPFYYKSNYVFSYRMADSLAKQEISKHKAIYIEKVDKNHFKINNNLTTKDNIENTLNTFYKKVSFYNIVLIYDNKMSFEEYFEIMSITKTTIDKLRNRQAIKGYGQNYNKLNRKFKRKIQEIHPWIFTDSIK